MEIGMLWFDNDKDAELSVKVTRAAQFYEDKYGKRPNLCFVHPCTVAINGNQKPTEPVCGVEIRESTSLQPNHFWIGVHNLPRSEDDAKTRRRDAMLFEMDMEAA